MFYQFMHDQFIKLRITSAEKKIYIKKFVKWIQECHTEIQMKQIHYNKIKFRSKIFHKLNIGQSKKKIKWGQGNKLKKKRKNKKNQSDKKDKKIFGHMSIKWYDVDIWVELVLKYN